MPTRLLRWALGLELPEDTLVNIHSYEDKNNAYCESPLAENVEVERIVIPRCD
jgi:hypothetical protein